MTTHQVRFYAGAAEAAGSPTAAVELPEQATLADLVTTLSAGNPRLGEVLPVCTLLLNGTPTSPTDPLPASPATIDVLPPFAGG